MLCQYTVFCAVIVDRLDVVPLADIHTQIDQGFICRIADGPVSAPLTVADLYRDCLVVIPRVAGCPRSVALQNALAYHPIIADAVVG